MPCLLVKNVGETLAAILTVITCYCSPVRTILARRKNKLVKTQNGASIATRERFISTAAFVSSAVENVPIVKATSRLTGCPSDAILRAAKRP